MRDLDTSLKVKEWFKIKLIWKLRQIFLDDNLLSCCSYGKLLASCADLWTCHHLFEVLVCLGQVVQSCGKNIAVCEVALCSHFVSNLMIE